MVQVCYFRQYLAQEGDSGFQVMGMIKGFFWVWNFRFRDFFWVGKSGEYFCWWIDLSRDFWGYSKQSEDLWPCSSPNKVQPNLASEIPHGIFWGLIFGPGIFFGFCWKPWFFFFGGGGGVVIFATMAFNHPITWNLEYLPGIFRQWNCFLSSVPMDSKDWHGLKRFKF